MTAADRRGDAAAIGAGNALRANRSSSGTALAPSLGRCEITVLAAGAPAGVELGGYLVGGDNCDGRRQLTVEAAAESVDRDR